MPILFTPTPEALRYSSSAMALQRLIAKHLAFEPRICSYCGGSGCVWCPPNR